MLTLTTIKESVNAMPEGSSFDDVIERLIYLRKIDDALEDVKNGNVYTHQEMKEYAKQWLKK
jgi:predicted CopG family antitoxin